MATGAEGAGGAGGGGAINADDNISQMEEAFDRAISVSAEVSVKRQEAGAALDAARTRLSN